MRIVMISDTHCQHAGMVIPEGDVLIHAGDFTARGREHEVTDFNDWLGSLPHTYKVVVPGNHDFLFEQDAPRGRALMTNADHVLIHEACEIEGLKFFGSPWTPEFYDWAFNYPASDGRGLWAAIPGATDILITHGPPHGIRDRVSRGHVGCPELLRMVECIRPKIHVFGHIHEGAGRAKRGPTTYINAAMLDGQYGFGPSAQFVDL